MRTFAAVLLANVWGFAGVCLANPIAWLGAVIPLSAAYIVTIRRLVRKADMEPASSNSEESVVELAVEAQIG